MRAVNPAYIPRTHRVEAAIQAAFKDAFHPFNDLMEVLSRPFVHQRDFAMYADPPQRFQRHA